MMNFTSRNRRNGGDDDQPPPYFQQMHDSCESLDCLDLEGLDKYAGGGQETSKTDDSVKQKVDNNSNLAPLSLSPGKSLSKTLSLADRASTPTKKAISPPSLDGKEPTDEKKKSKRGGKREDFKRSQSEKMPSTPPTPSVKKRSMTPMRRRSGNEAAAEAPAKDAPVGSPQTPKTPRTPGRLMKALSIRRNPSNDSDFTQMMNDSIESLDFVNLQGLEDGGKKNQEKESEGEKAGALAALRKSMVNTFSPRKKTQSVGSSKGIEAAPQLDSPRSPVKQPSRRSMTPFRRGRNQESSSSEEAPKTPKTPKSKLRSITPFRREPSNNAEDESTNNGSPTNKKTRMSLSPFKRTKSVKKIEDDPLEEGLLGSSSGHRMPSSSSHSTDFPKVRPVTPRRAKKRPEPEIIAPKPEKGTGKISSKSSRSTTPYRKERTERSSTPGRKGTATEQTGPSLEAFMKTESSPRKSKSSSKSVSSRKSKKSLDRSVRTTRTRSPTKSGSKSSSKKTQEVESPRRTRARSRAPEPTAANSNNNTETQETQEDQPKRRRTKTPIRRRPQAPSKKVENSPQPQDDIRSQAPSKKVENAPQPRNNELPQAPSIKVGNAPPQPRNDERSQAPSMKAENVPQPQDDDTTSSSTRSSSSGQDDANGDDPRQGFVQRTISNLEESIHKVENTPGLLGADVTAIANMPAHHRPCAFNDLSWIKEARKLTDTAAITRSVSAGRVRENNIPQSLTGTAILHNRSKSTGRASAVASAALLHDAPTTPRSRSRVLDRRSIGHGNDCTSLHTAGTRKTTGTRGTSARGAAAARRGVVELRPMPSISVPSS